VAARPLTDAGAATFASITVCTTSTTISVSVSHLYDLVYSPSIFHSVIYKFVPLPQKYEHSQQFLTYTMFFLSRLLSSLTTTDNLVSAPAAPTSESHKCRFRLDNDSADTLTLPDGRRLGYAQYGSLTQRAVFYLHGLPGSRTEGAYFHDLGLESGTRIVAMDRPGVGLSSPHLNRTLLDFPKDLECLAKHLGLEEFAVLVRGKPQQILGLSINLLGREYQEVDHTHSLAQRHYLAKSSSACPLFAA
jgi:hypothetical protein